MAGDVASRVGLLDQALRKPFTLTGFPRNCAGRDQHPEPDSEYRGPVTVGIGRNPTTDRVALFYGTHVLLHHPYVRGKCLARNSLANFPMQGMAAQVLIKLLLFDASLLFFLVTARHVTGNGLPFGAGFGALQNDVFSGHGLMIRCELMR